MILPVGSIEQQVRMAAEQGLAADDIVTAVLGPVRELLRANGNAAFADWARPAVRKMASDAARKVMRRDEDEAFMSGRSTSSRIGAMNRMEFIVTQGTRSYRVHWKDATEEEHALRIAWLNATIAGHARDRRRHQAAVELIQAHRVRSLSEIPDWENLLPEEEPAST